jgi:hypothetical protein
VVAVSSTPLSFGILIEYVFDEFLASSEVGFPQSLNRRPEVRQPVSSSQAEYPKSSSDCQAAVFSLTPAGSIIDQKNLRSQFFRK